MQQNCDRSIDVVPVLWPTLQHIVSQLSADDSIYVFGMHASTLPAAPLYTGYIPVLSPQAGLSERLRLNGGRQKVREEETEAIKQALIGKANAKQTDIFGAVDRIRPDDKGHHTILYFFSDMEHVTVVCGERSCLGSTHLGARTEPVRINVVVVNTSVPNEAAPFRERSSHELTVLVLHPRILTIAIAAHRADLARRVLAALGAYAT